MVPAPPGQTIPDKPGREGPAAPDYKALYYELFRASEQAVRLLQQAQARAEEAYLQEEPPLRLAPDKPPADQGP